MGAFGRAGSTCRWTHSRSVVAITCGHDGGGGNGRLLLVNRPTP